MSAITETDITETAITEAMLRLVAERGAGKSICPSEVARALGGPHPDGWGPLMKPVRHVAVGLAHAGRIAILRKGRPVDPDDFRGVYRLALPGGADSDEPAADGTGSGGGDSSGPGSPSGV